MTTDSGRLGLGAFLVALGAIVLAARAELVDPRLIPPLADVWPLLLVAVGIAVMIRAATPALGSIVVGAALGVGAGLVLSGGAPTIGCGPAADEPLVPTANGAFSAPGSVTVELPCGELQVAVGGGTEWAVSAAGQPPRVEESDAALAVTGDRAGFARGSQRWRVDVPGESTDNLATTVNAGRAVLELVGARLDTLSVTVNAGELVANLDGATVRELSATVNAGTVRVAMPADASVRGSLSANAGSVELCIPENAGLRIRSESTLGGSNLEDVGLTETADGVWQNETFETAANRIDLTTSTNLGSLTLNPDDGCEP